MFQNNFHQNCQTFHTWKKVISRTSQFIFIVHFSTSFFLQLFYLSALHGSNLYISCLLSVLQEFPLSVLYVISLFFPYLWVCTYLCLSFIFKFSNYNL